MTGKRWLAFKLVSMLLIIISLTSAMLVSEVDEVKFWTMLGITALASIAYLVLFYASQKNLHQFVKDMKRELDVTEKDALYRFPSPAVIIDEAGTIVWYNISFVENVHSAEAFGVNIKKIIDVDIEKIANGKENYVKHQSSYFKITSMSTAKPEKVSKENDKNYTLLYFEDVSEFMHLKTEFSDLRPIVMLITIDNYEDTMSGEKDSEISHILIKIEKLVESYIEEYSGILRKLSRDKFFAVAERKSVELMIANKFKLIEEVRKIPLSGKTPITVSIGVGFGAENLIDSEIFAKQALEMAQGRGGDQVAIKKDEGYEFIGGVVKGIEKQTKVKTRIVATALIELINSSEKVFIMGHRNGDMDSVGSALGMLGAIRLMNSEIFSTVVVDSERCLAKPLISRVKDNLTEEENIFTDIDSAIELMDERSLLIIVDTHNKDILESIELYEKAPQIAVIDHHRQVVNYIDNAVIFHHEPYASSACEMVAEILQYFPNINTIQSYFADALLAGIMLDTKDFIMRTGVRTFEAAAFLRKLGADMVAVKGLFTNSIESIKQRSALISTAEIYNKCAIAVEENFTKDGRIVAAQAADLMLGIDEVAASFVIFPLENGAGINISARSLGAMNVQIIMEKLGGGGHQTMAATQIMESTVGEAKAKLIAAIDEHIQNIS